MVSNGSAVQEWVIRPVLNVRFGSKADLTADLRLVRLVPIYAARSNLADVSCTLRVIE
jgi:hypothetical protein